MRIDHSAEVDKLRHVTGTSVSGVHIAQAPLDEITGIRIDVELCSRSLARYVASYTVLALRYGNKFISGISDVEWNRGESSASRGRGRARRDLAALRDSIACDIRYITRHIGGGVGKRRGRLNSSVILRDRDTSRAARDERGRCCIFARDLTQSSVSRRRSCLDVGTSKRNRG